MTGEKNRYKTTERLWKFQDETLTTPAHDELICELLDPGVAKKLLNKIYIGDKNEVILTPKCRFDAEYFEKEFLNYFGIYQNKIEFLNFVYECLRNNMSEESIYNYVKSSLPKKCLYEYESKCCNSGFFEKLREYYLQTFANRPQLAPVDIYFRDYFDVGRVETELPILGGNQFLCGYWDIVINYRTFGELTPNCTGLIYEYISDCNVPQGKEWALFVEVKPKIESFGNTIRQIKSYTSWDHRAQLFQNVCLFTPDLRFKSQFKSQGVQVVSPDDLRD